MPEHLEAYPLTWPQGYPRTKRPKSSQFQTSFASARDGLLDELRLMRARRPILSTNIPLRQDGLPYARFRAPEDAGVAVYFEWEGEQRVLCCDRWRKVEDNLQAVRKTVEALRGLDRWGVSEILARTFSGFRALPETGSGRTWWQTLSVEKTASEDEIRRAFRRRAHETHPDKGGSVEEWAELQDAYSQAQAALGTVAPTNGT